VVRIAITILACTACATPQDDRDPSTTSATTTASSEDGTTSSSSSSSSATTDDTFASVDSGSDSSTTSADPPSIARIGDTFVIPTLAASTPKRFADVAHDPVSDVYLQVNGNVATSGTFLAGDAAILGEAFAIADTDAYTQGVRVAWGGEAFLVAWHDNREGPDTARLRGRRVQWDGAPQLGADVELGTGDTYSEMPPALAWSMTSASFLVVWHAAAGDDIHAQRVDAEGTRIGTPILVTADPDWQSDAGVAWNPDRDEWLVVYTHAGATTEVRARLVAADGTLLGEAITIATAAGTWLAHAAFDSSTGDYLVAWFEGRIAARTLAADGTFTSDVFELASGFGSYDGFALAHDPSTGWFAAAFHGNTDEDFAIAFDATGVQSEVIEATSSRGEDGNFNPRIASRGEGEWLLVTSRGFADIVGQRLGP
jgi:hypothetical protein